LLWYYLKNVDFSSEKEESTIIRQLLREGTDLVEDVEKQKWKKGKEHILSL
jgi:hypothetical protein